MAYADLGANYAAPTTSLRAFQTYVATKGATPLPWNVSGGTTTFGTKTPVAPAPAPRPVASTPTTFRPITTTTPVLKPAAPTLKPTVSLAPTTVTTKPVVVSGGASPTSPLQVADESADMSNAFSFTKSPLPLIAIGIAALFLFNRKGR